MVKVNIINHQGASFLLIFDSMEDACIAMDALASTVATDIAFTVMPEKEPVSRFVNPAGGKDEQKK